MISFLHTWRTIYSSTTYSTLSENIPKTYKNQNPRRKQMYRTILFPKQTIESVGYLKKVNKVPVQWPKAIEQQDVTKLIEKNMLKERTDRSSWHWRR